MKNDDKSHTIGKRLMVMLMKDGRTSITYYRSNGNRLSMFYSRDEALELAAAINAVNNGE